MSAQPCWSVGLVCAHSLALSLFTSLLTLPCPGWPAVVWSVAGGTAQPPPSPHLSFLWFAPALLLSLFSADLTRVPSPPLRFLLLDRRRPPSPVPCSYQARSAPICHPPAHLLLTLLARLPFHSPAHRPPPSLDCSACGPYARELLLPPAHSACAAPALPSFSLSPSHFATRASLSSHARSRVREGRHGRRGGEPGARTGGVRLGGDRGVGVDHVAQ